MATNFTHRVLLIVPAAKMAAVAAWLAANVDPTETATWPGLSPTGTAPATHHWWSSALVDTDCRQMLAKLCQLASIAA